MSESQKILNKYWGYTAFRSLQEDIINSVLDGKDTLALLPTGGGKSICFQIPALVKEGICIVVSPLIALINDQVKGLNKRGIKALSIVSGMSYREIDHALDNCVFGNFKFLYLSPERLKNELVKERISRMNVTMFAIDEAHCISQWGYDFRPAYLEISLIRELHPNAPVLALTATATPEVVTDIQSKLNFKKENAFKKSFERSNLSYNVVNVEDKNTKLIHILTKLPGSSIVYSRNRKKTKEIADYLTKNKISADYYHAGLSTELRNKKQEDWLKNKTRVIVSTNAFGMGIDKPDVRIVIHMDIPDTLEAYFQEAGRAGRDENQAYAVLLFNDNDKLQLKKQIEQNYPPIDEIKRIYEGICTYYRLAVGSGKHTIHNFNIEEFCNTYNQKAISVFSSLKILERENYISLSEQVLTSSRIKINASKETIYNVQIKSKQYEEFIKLLLRSYSGVFEEYVKINETEIAKRMNADKNIVVKYLSKLHELNIVDYIPYTQLPQLTFEEERIDVKNLWIKPENYLKLKERAFKNMDSVIHYISSGTRCRSRILMSYFGQKESADCNSCDVCRRKKKDLLDSNEAVIIQNHILELLKKKSLSLNDLVMESKIKNDKSVLTIVQWLLDSDKIRYSNKNRLEIISIED